MNGTNTMSAKKHYINYMIMFMLTIVISLLPPVGAITPFGMQVIGILVGVLYGWIKIGLVVPSVFAMLALGISGYNSVLGVFSTGLGQQQVLLVIFSGLLAGAMEEAGLTAYLTKILLSQKQISFQCSDNECLSRSDYI